MDGMSLLDVLRGVMLDPAEQAAYNADPNAYLEQYGYDDVDPADLSEAFGLVADTLPPDQAQAALSAAADPDDSSFGSVTPDFDGEAGVVDADLVATDDGGDGDVTDAAGQPDADLDTTLSFGEGEGVDIGVVEPPADDGFDDDAFGDLAPGEPDAAGPGELAVDGTDDAAAVSQDGDLEPGDDIDEIDDLDDDFAATLDDGSADLDDALSAPPVEHPDDTDDLAEIDGLGGFDEQGPDDLDIGSF